MHEVKGLVSVAIPFLNSERFLREAIESVVAQTYLQWELFLVDDGSTDGSTQIALNYSARSPERIHYLNHPGHANRGLACSRNFAVRNSAGEFLAFLDSDDVWLPCKLEEQVRLADAHPEAGLIYGRSEYWFDRNSDGKATKEIDVQALPPGERIYFPPELLKSCYPFGPYGAPCPSDFFLRRQAFDRVRGFEESFNPATHQFYEDQAFLAKIYLNVPVFVSDHCWDRYRIHDSSMTSLIHNTNREDDERWFYFRWLMKYLRRNAVRDPKIWTEVLRQSGRYWLPLSPGAIRLLQIIRTRIWR